MLVVAAALTGCLFRSASGARLWPLKKAALPATVKTAKRSPTFTLISMVNGERYLRVQLQAYRSQKRENAVMYPMAKDLTDEEIRILAAHYEINSRVERAVRAWLKTYCMPLPPFCSVWPGWLRRSCRNKCAPSHRSRSHRLYRLSRLCWLPPRGLATLAAISSSIGYGTR